MFSSISEHGMIISNWLDQSTSYRSLSKSEQVEIWKVLLTIDMLAANAAGAIWDSSRTIDELSRGMPSTIKRDRDRNAWSILEAFKTYLEHAAATREAIFAGQWGTAVEMAFYSGTVHLPHHQIVGRKVLDKKPRKRGVGPKLQAIVHRNSRLIAEALDMRARNATLSVDRIADTLAKKHRCEKGYPQKDAIRKILGQSRKLGKQGLPSQKTCRVVLARN
jgi:hypothetical protein